VIPHPAYSPDIVPSDFHLYPSTKKELKGRIFEPINAVIGAAQAMFKRKSEEGFEAVFEAWQKRWDKQVHCIAWRIY